MPAPGTTPTRVLVLSLPGHRGGTTWTEDPAQVTEHVVGGTTRRPVGGRQRVRRLAGRLARTARESALRRVPPAPVWRRLRDDLPTGPFDVVVSTDPRLDGAAADTGRLAGAATVLGHDEGRHVAALLARLREHLRRVGEHVRTERHAPAPEAVAALRDAAGALLADCPDVLVPVDLVAAQARAWVVRLPHQPAAELVDAAFGGLPWPAPAGPSGLEARLRWARLATDPDPDTTPASIRAAALRAVDGSEAALAAGRPGLAVDRWSDAWELLYDRELHTAVGSSPLVEDPASWLAPLVRSAVHAALTAPRRSDRPAAPPTLPDRRPRVLVGTGAYGSFHAEVVQALAPAADVTTVDLTDVVPRLRQYTRAHRRGLRDVAAVRGLVEDRRQDERTERVRRACAGYDVVLTDWVDASAVWLSHVLPPEVRLVVRVHSVDALAGWFPLVDWSVVDEVVVIAPTMRSLVLDLLAALGVTDLPVTMLPGLVAVGTLAADKEPGARTTLGLVGWSRRVKDVAWALDLLERLPDRRLVLVGHPLTGSSGTARSRAYATEVLRRLESPGLRERVEAVGYTDDVGAALRRVGVILSTSRREGNHHGLIEGAASGAVPVVRDWPLVASRGGARAVYPPEWVVGSVEEAADRVRRTSDDEATWERERHAAREQALDLVDPDRAAEAYRATVLARPLSPGAGSGSRG